MNTCKKHQDEILELITGSLDAGRLAALKNHCRTCSECDAMLSIHTRLSQMEDPVTMPSETEFLRIRQNVQRQIRLKQGKRRVSVSQFLLDVIRKPVFAYSIALASLAAGILLNIGLFNSKTGHDRTLITQIDYTAAQNTGLKDIENSPYTFSNVSIEDMTDDQIRLSFNVSTHVEIVRQKSDPLVRDVLAQSLLNPEPTGMRIRNMDYVQKIMDPKIKEALIFSLQKDPALPVRLKALTNLMQYKNDEAIQAAFLQVVRDEESVQMRLLAIDYLAQNKIDATLLSGAVEASSLDLKAPVLVRTQRYTELSNQ